jgi:integrase
VVAVLTSERGHHRDRVFTYLSHRTRHDPHAGVAQEKGRRYPFTLNGWRKEWKAALDAAGIRDFRFHDLRHTAATRALNAHRNLKTVQRMLGHKAIATTLRYTRSDVEDVRAAMEAVENTQARRLKRVERE